MTLNAPINIIDLVICLFSSRERKEVIIMMCSLLLFPYNKKEDVFLKVTRLPIHEDTDVNGLT
jgi:hypothetical protein